VRPGSLSDDDGWLSLRPLPELRKKTSHRNMSEIDKLSWLVLGRASKGLGHTDTALLQRAALALLTRGRWWDE
jgi:hypothetical protein